MKFNRDRTAVRSDLNGLYDYRDAIKCGNLLEIRIRPTVERSRMPYWRVAQVETLIPLGDNEANHPLEVSAFVIGERAAVVDELTRHRYTHQVFIPITGSILGVVCRCSASPEQPDSSNLEIVSVRPGEALFVGQGTWHTLPFAFTEPVVCLSVMHREDLDSYHDVRDLAAAGWVAFVEWSDPVGECK